MKQEVDPAARPEKELRQNFMAANPANPNLRKDNLARRVAELESMLRQLIAEHEIEHHRNG